MTKVRVAVIGCGSIAERRHIPEYAEHPNVELVAFADPIIERAEGYAKRFDAKAYSDYKELLAAGGFDAVACAPRIFSMLKCQLLLPMQAHMYWLRNRWLCLKKKHKR
jgi:hypothetical protein